MKKSILLAAVSFLISVTSLLAGEVRFIMINYVDVPGYQPGVTLMDPDTLASIEVELTLEQDAKKLEDAGCPLLAKKYLMFWKTKAVGMYLRKVAAMDSSDLFIYFICDAKGLTPAMKDYAGVCDYDDPDEAGDTRYAWISAQYIPERSLKIGEHYCASMIKMAVALGNTNEVAGHQLLNAYMLGELLHTAFDAPWQPNNILIQPTSVNFSFRDEKAKTIQAGPGLVYYPMYTVMEHEDGAKVRTIEVAIGASTSMDFKMIYEKLLSGNAYLATPKDSRITTEWNTKPDIDMGNGFVGYLWSSVPVDGMFDNEIFGGLLIRYFAHYHPQIKDMFNETKSPMSQVISHFYERKTATVGLVDVLSSLMETYANQDGITAEQIRERRLFLFAVIDVLSEFRMTRDVLEANLSITVIPEMEIKPLLDTYFDATSGQRANIKNLAKKCNGVLFSTVEDLAAMYHQKRTELFLPSDQTL